MPIYNIVSVYICIHSDVYMCVEARASSDSIPRTLHLIFLRQNHLINLALTDLSRLSSHLSLPPPA